MFYGDGSGKGGMLLACGAIALHVKIRLVLMIRSVVQPINLMKK